MDHIMNNGSGCPDYYDPDYYGSDYCDSDQYDQIIMIRIVMIQINVIQTIADMLGMIDCHDSNYYGPD